MARFHWVPLSFVSVCLFSSPAEAAKLMSWRFESSQNQLSFTTNGGVQPKAKLITNPTRLVIDLPKTKLDRPTVEESFGGMVKSVRVGQFDAETTRIVVELAGGYTIDPEQINIRGASPTQWTVKLPEPKPDTLPLPQNEQNEQSRVSDASSRPSQRRRVTRENPPPSLPEQQESVSEENTNAAVSFKANEEPSLDLQMTSNGLFVRFDGGEGENIKMKRSSDRRLIEFELDGVVLPASLASQKLAVNNYGVSEIEFTQSSNSRGKATIVLKVTEDSPDWQASFSRSGGLVLWPVGGMASVDTGNSSGLSISSAPQENKKPTIKSVRLGENNEQLLIEADQELAATGNWNASEGVYEITIPDAQLDERFQNPELDVNSPIYQLRIWESDSNTVMVQVQPALGVRIEELNQPSAQFLALQLRGLIGETSVRSTNTSNATRAVEPPPKPLPPNRVQPPRQLSSLPNERISVMIDPGHGGKDPGARGIGGIQEKDIILPISQQVAQILERNGVQVILTRSADYFVSLEGRANMANRANADIFVSIHANSMGMSRPDVNGLETYYYETGKELAATIHRNILGEVDVNDRRVRRARFYVLRKTSMPAVLVEVGFLTGNEDAAKLANSAYRQDMAEALANGILQYIRQR
ncbi:MAG: N-acetylmuramoyl-L-alanine amidase [Gomphosphaeria aponina SAG 52.96 = DSM 107014]|uniref:N-acetylmuramoyl-L-alanine amidase n=1 Tax=Gomphosphaeria aponina SAG 52.96 = DSM 107014 TaxID=1521640 RepID=A0A941GSY4_9CHRO|nr:N-acetylmuramoyl-L-alanine amidase [Gomphosphaeria aponina SAG 52.96 = DSM 107014]